MSQPTDKTTPFIGSFNPDSEPSVVVEKKSLVRRGVNFVKTHKKPVIATALLSGLVGVSAFVGRKTAPSIDGVYIPEPEVDYTADLEELARLEAEATETA